MIEVKPKYGIPIYPTGKDGADGASSSGIEATQKGTSTPQKLTLARQIFSALQKEGFISKKTNPSLALIKTIASVIKDDDQDGYLDVSNLSQLAKKLAGILKKDDPEKMGNCISGLEHADRYFKDYSKMEELLDQSLFGNSKQLKEKESISKNPLYMAGKETKLISEGIKHFRSKYLLKHGKDWWRKPNLIDDFQKEMHNYLKSNFIHVWNLNDNAFAGTEITDSTLNYLSKDHLGRVRIDCRMYALISAQIFKSVGLKTSFAAGYENESGIGHAFTIAKACSDKQNTTFISSSEYVYSITSSQGKAITELDLITKIDEEETEYQSLAFASDIDKAAELALSKMPKMKSFSLLLKQVEITVNFLAKYKNSEQERLLMLYSDGKERDSEFYGRRILETLNELEKNIDKLPKDLMALTTAGTTVKIKSNELSDLIRNLRIVIFYHLNNYRPGSLSWEERNKYICIATEVENAFSYLSKIAAFKDLVAEVNKRFLAANNNRDSGRIIESP
ncbi:hypothetical protein A2276_06610 [candidate division WOR-1 bacterium RIFOXYA12_FULL_43_27]|uniref:Uncharacterized protein n=1 Tax=candidate division WOR-1 bacterium RIFOXYC2_FULL_46_14 TaxID=1802587 RepID=A0A1F4U5D0_UNCSA|nr:MAG: hypothetical protein A2276_06610 [candidate division WOR-1 bacterium RIFOXYA12_FULL_43_27]OGC20318.1 MAG: hypothetical protein A2292_04610 [candidate division WOR-1 bacterium RIFOXYB2_FULL_46_45]OGC31945.1 MAG: hypothetical protein A2232_06840 [candidate division WOR-1 bacterium RIFOXYA2_FULL_46_56]OGC40164.1 MAG: hypothetical protein A2438_02630 [candidate division WOR-1 bacterium RIFOXYC2_FULL_46_14]